MSGGFCSPGWTCLSVPVRDNPNIYFTFHGEKERGRYDEQTAESANSGTE